MNHCCDYIEGTFPDLKEIKDLWKNEKKRWAGIPPEMVNNCYRLTHERNKKDDLVVNIEYLIFLMEITGCEGGDKFYWMNKTSPIYVQRQVETPSGEMCKIDGLLLPIRVYDDKKCINDKTELKISTMWGKPLEELTH